MIKQLNATDKEIEIAIVIDQSKLDRRAELIVQVYCQTKKLQTHVIGMPFPQSHSIINLKHQTIYTLKARLENKQSNTFYTLHVYTAANPNNVIEHPSQVDKKVVTKVGQSEELLARVIAAENEGLDIFDSNTRIKEMILKARKNSNAKGFIRSEYKICKPPELKQERFRRIWMISKGHQFFDEVYGENQKGQQFLQNDWNMGPFYSYDLNEQQLKQKQQQLNLQINQSENNDQ